MKKIKITGAIILAVLLLTPFWASSASLTSLNGTYMIHDLIAAFMVVILMHGVQLMGSGS